MALLGDAGPESEAIGWLVQRQVRQLVLEAVPGPSSEAVTVGSLALRLDIAHHRIRSVLRQLESAGAICSTNGGGTIRYHRDNEEANTMTPEADPRPLADRVLELLEDHEPLTILEIASRLSTRPNSVSAALVGLEDLGKISREGLGKRGDPFRHSIAENEAPGSTEAPDLEETDTPGPPDPEPSPCTSNGHTNTDQAELEEGIDPTTGGPLSAGRVVEPGGPFMERQAELAKEAEATEQLERVAHQLAEDLGLEVVIRRPGEGPRPMTQAEAYEVVVENLGRRCSELRRELEILEAALELARRIRCEERDLAIDRVEEQVREEAAR